MLHKKNPARWESSKGGEELEVRREKLRRTTKGIQAGASRKMKIAPNPDAKLTLPRRIVWRAIKMAAAAEWERRPRLREVAQG
jgi:hypothetical protein